MKRKTLSLRPQQIRKLIRLATQARKHAIAPYTKIKVGAAILTKSSKIFTGANYQSMIPDVSICAERAAVFKALSEGKKSILAVAVVGFKKDFLYPCGLCRQILSEFNQSAIIIAANLKGEYKIVNLKDLTPMIPVLN